MSDALEIRPLDLLDEDQTGDAERWLEVHSAVQRELFADKGSEWSLGEVRAMHGKGDTSRFHVAAWSRGEVVGALEVRLPLLDNPSVAMFWLSVRADARRRGVGSTLLAEAERIGTAHGRTCFLVESEWAEGGRDPAEGFAREHGYAVAQTTLRSEMALPGDRQRLRELVDAPGAADYALESYVDEMPEDWLEDRAALQQRMSTDAPLDDLAYGEELWDAYRLRQAQRSTRDAGRRIIESAARHGASGRLVGFTQVALPASEPGLAYQQDTLVTAEHRGHGLGLRLKAANALLVMDVAPQVRAVRTWNAASNDHMLAVNRALGYVVDGYQREWQRRVPSSG